MDDNEFAARVEGNKIVANVIRTYQRQLAEAHAERDALRAEYADYQRVAQQSIIESMRATPARWDRELGTVAGYVVVQVGSARPICRTYDEYDQAREVAE
jgi:hypothetical protein